MPRAVQSFLPVAGTPAALATAFEGDPEAWLTEPRREGAADQWVVTLHAAAFRRTVRLRIGDPWLAGRTRWRSLSWDPIGADGAATSLDRLLPSFDGELGLHIGHDERVTLVLDGRYQPPGGRLGTAVDAIALHRLAQVTTGSFLADVAARLAAEACLDDLARPELP